MKKINIIFSTCLFILCLSLTATHARDLELVIKEVDRIGEEEVIIKYGILNRKNFDRPNVSIAFKILVDNKPIGGKENRTLIRNGSDGSDIKETIINTSRGDKEFRL